MKIVTGQGTTSKVANNLLPFLTPLLEFPALGVEPTALVERTTLGKGTLTVEPGG